MCFEPVFLTLFNVLQIAQIKAKSNDFAVATSKSVRTQEFLLCNNFAISNYYYRVPTKKLNLNNANNNDFERVSIRFFSCN